MHKFNNPFSKKRKQVTLLKKYRQENLTKKTSSGKSDEKNDQSDDEIIIQEKDNLNIDIQKEINPVTKKNATSHFKELKQPEYYIEKSPKTVVIALKSFQDAVGCTYISKALANYIKNDTISSVEQISGKGQFLNHCYKKNIDDICSLYTKYDFIILDLGNEDNFTNDDFKEYGRADIKILVCKNESDYYKKIMNQIRKDPDKAEEVIYFFNLIPLKQRSEIDDLMEDFSYCIAGMIDSENIDKETKKIFMSILPKKRRRLI